MSSLEEANALLAGMGGRAAKFERVGDDTKGIILAVEVRPQTKMGTGEVLTFEDGTPRKQLVITLQTEEREDEDDDGVRKLYAKAEMTKAIRRVAPSLAIGAKLAVRYTGDGEAAAKGWNAPKLFRAWYEAPAVTVPVGDDGDEDVSPF